MWKIVLLFWEISVVGLNIFEILLEFFIIMSFKTNGRENSNVHNFLPDLSNDPSTFYKFLGLLSGETRILGRKIPLKDRYHATILYTRIYKEFDSAQYIIFSSLVSFFWRSLSKRYFCFRLDVFCQIKMKKKI